MKQLEIKEADFSNQKDAEAVVQTVNLYAQDPMGLERRLSAEVQKKLAEELKAFPTTICFIARIDGEPAGVANCFYGFSTFNAAKLINIHDLAVNPKFRGRGIGEALLAEVEKKAKETGCCKVTLEVREDNRAKNLYERFGFEYGDPPMFYMSKDLVMVDS